MLTQNYSLRKKNVWTDKSLKSKLNFKKYVQLNSMILFPELYKIIFKKSNVAF